MMRILIMSGPNGSLANALLKSEASELICITDDDVFLCAGENQVTSGTAIALPLHLTIDVPTIRSQLLKAYPLIDRWVSKRQSISTTIEQMLQYTLTLIQIVGNHRPRFAILETGAPHHLFSYCLDTALRYLDIHIYYLYGNAFDGRCLVVNGNEKSAVVPVSDYSAEKVVDEYIMQVQRNAMYTPADSSKSLTPTLHKNRLYAISLYLRGAVGRLRLKLKSRTKLGKGTVVRLALPHVGLIDLLGILRAHKKYQDLLATSEAFNTNRIQEGDIVYVGHMLPEATSFPESPEYPGEIDVLIDLKNRFPAANIYYREHPAIALYAEFGHIHLQGLHKCPSFFSQLNQIGIVIIPPSFHISKIRQRNCLFATKTGRVAVENSVLGIPTLLYGFPFYGRHLPLAFHVSKLPPKTSVQDIRMLAADVADHVPAVREHLIDVFSGSIENPGIGLGSDSSARPLFAASVVRLARLLGRRQFIGDSGIGHEAPSVSLPIHASY